MRLVRPVAATGLLALLILAGCAAPPGPATVPPAQVDGDVLDLSPILAANTMTFTQSVVTAAQGVVQDLYEPTMEVSDTDTIYVAGHVIGAATTGTPAYFSTDHGVTWHQLPFVATVQSPAQGAQPPPGDEGFLVAGDNGQAWMADIYAAGFTVTGWCDNGARQCYDNRYAYDRTATACSPASLNDRPWAAYANGTLLLVNNPGNGVMQLGVLDVPPAQPAGLFDPMTGPKWNMCASQNGEIPGIPSMREDGFFAVPQATGRGEDHRMTVVTGNKANIHDVSVRDVFAFTNSGGGTTNGGRTGFDQEGTLYVGAYNNTQPDAEGVREGRFVLAVSQDDGRTFTSKTFVTGSMVRSFYIDGNMDGAGALVTWSQLGKDGKRSDWYVAHAFVGADRAPVLRNVTLAVNEGPHSSAHVMGAAAGPDGRAYFVNFEAGSQVDYVASTPLSVWMQKDGPVLPVHGLAGHVHETTATRDMPRSPGNVS